MNNDFLTFKEHSCIKEKIINSLVNDIRYVKDSCVLLRDALDLKEKANSERDKQIAEAKERIRTVDDFVDDYESVRKIALDTRDFVLNSHEERKEFFRKWEARAWKIIATIGTGIIVSIACDLLK